MLAAALRGAQLVLLALCAFFLYATVAPHLAAAPPLRDVKLGGSPPPESSPALADFAVVWEHDPFAPARIAPAANAIRQQIAKVAAASKLSWRLVTTAAATRPELSVAGLVSTTDGSRRTVRIGDEIGGRTVVEIQRRRLILDKGGALEQLSLDDEPTAAAVAPRRRATTRPPGVRPVVRPRLGQARVPRPPVRPEPPPPAPSPDAMSSLLSDQVELQPEEEIVSINGLALDDPQIGTVANDGGELRVGIRGSDGSEREVVVGAPK